MVRGGLFLLVAFSLAAPFAAARGATVPADRGRLSLAWDAHDAGLFDEALQHLAGIGDGSELRGDAAWLRAECLYDLGRYEEAVSALEGASGLDGAERDRLLGDVFLAWAGSATRREDYGEASRILTRGVQRLPGGELEIYREAARYREALAEAVGKGGGRLASGERVMVRPLAAQAPGGEWMQAYPWPTQSPWLPEWTLEDWMPRLASRLQSAEEVLWVSVESSLLAAAVARSAEREGLGFAIEDNRYRFSRGQDVVWSEPERWRARAGVEGLGTTAAGFHAATAARDDLRAREQIGRWVQRNRGRLDVRWDAGNIRVCDSTTGRVFDLKPEVWSQLFWDDPEQWEQFWSELRLELARPAMPFRCFCGRPMTLREVLVGDSPGLLVLESGPGYVLGALAVCSLHHQPVTVEVAREWGVDASAIRERARRDALKQAWPVDFWRGEAEGFAYLVLDGDGISSLARYPEILAGALESVEGRAVRGRSVQVRALTPSTLLVTEADATQRARDEALTRSLRRLGRWVDQSERLSYAATVRLPAQGSGLFRVSLAE